MKPITVYSANNEKGEELFNIIDKMFLSTNHKVSRHENNNSRDEFIKVFRNSSLIILDCSLDKEGGHIYRALHEWIKTKKKYIIVSRTPIPRNILAFHQYVPMHGKTFSNEDIQQWLTTNLPIILERELANPSKMLSSFTGFYQVPNLKYDYFISFRGSQERQVEQWKTAYENESASKVKMVETGEYSYPTECLTLQQMWEGVAKLQYVMWNIGKVLIYKSEDYFDSFWTSSEFLSIVSYHYPIQNNIVSGIYLIDDNTVNPLKINSELMNIRRTNKEEKQIFKHLLNNSDPYVVGPETRLKPQGAQKIIAPILRLLIGHYKPEFSGKNWWDIVRVPCPNCKPLKRTPKEVDWLKHLSTYKTDANTVDYFGYFPVSEDDLNRGVVNCPSCKKSIKLENKRDPRTLWMPILSTEKDQDRAVITALPLWEVIQ